jgi:hypothetical protein
MKSLHGIADTRPRYLHSGVRRSFLNNSRFVVVASEHRMSD